MMSLERWNYLYSLVVASLISIYFARLVNYDEEQAKCSTDIDVARLDRLAREHVAMTFAALQSEHGLLSKAVRADCYYHA